jgi:hypothetical protein
MIGDRAVLVGPEGLIVVPADPTGPLMYKPLAGAEQLAVSEARLWVSTHEPGQLLAFSLADFTESERIAIPSGARGFAITPSGTALVVSDTRLSAIDLKTRALTWSVELAPLADTIVLRGDGTSAWVTHRVGDTTSITPHRDGWSLPPTVNNALAGTLRVGSLSIGITHERVMVIDGVVAEDQARPEMVLLGNAAPARWSLPALPDHTFARALSNTASGNVIIATDDFLLTVAPVPGSDAIARVPHDCKRPRAMVVSDATSSVHMACADGRVATVPLSADEPVVYRDAVAPLDACAGLSVDGGLISERFKREFLTASSVEAVLRQYQCRYPARTHLFPIAKTHGGRNVWALAIGREPASHDRPTILINGGHHGDELMAVNFALDAVQALLEDNVADGALEDVVFVVVPLVNPDGNHHRLVDNFFGRKNGRDNDKNGTRDHEEGVDLNRNYPFRWGALGENGSRSKATHKWYRGPSAGSEPETQGMMRLANSEKFVAAMSFHTGTLALCAPYTIPNVKQPEPDAAWIVGHEIVAQLPPHPEGPVPVKRRLYPLDGNDQDWHRHANGTLAFLWEGAKHWLAHRRPQLLVPARASWMWLAKRFVNGPSVSVRTFDMAGNPLAAEIAFDEVVHFEGERWTTRCRDGRFDYILPRKGTYTVTVSAGGRTVKRKVEVTDGRPTVNVMLPVLTDRPAVCPTPEADAGAAATFFTLP